MSLTRLTVVQGPSIGNCNITSLTIDTVSTTDTTSINTLSASTYTTNGYAVPFVAGETIAIRDALYVEPTLTQGTAGRVYKMDADVLVKSTQALFVGFAANAASAGANVQVQLLGVVSGFSGLTAGALYYANSTAGTITATKPLHPIPVGMALSTTELLINTRKREREQTEDVTAIYGYAFGGNTAAVVATTDRVVFSTSTTAASTVNNLSVARSYATGVSDTQISGYAMGGFTASAVAATTDRTTFSTSTTAAFTASNLSVARQGAAGVSDGAIYGYAMGGRNATPAIVATTDRIAFTTTALAAFTVGNLSQAREGAGGISDASVYGYALGGLSGTATTTSVVIGDRLTFSTSTTAALVGSNLSSARSLIGTTSDGATYGYALGGQNTTPSAVTTADRLTFSTSGTAALTSMTLSTARVGLAGTSDGAVYGYLLGGGTGATVYNTADRITFSSSTIAAVTGANLSAARQGVGGFSDGAV